MTRLLCGALALAIGGACFGFRSSPRAPGASTVVCRYEILRTASGCSVVEKTWRIAANGLAEFDDSAERPLALGVAGVGCSASIMCDEAPVVTRPECARPVKTAAFSWDGGGCRFVIGAPVWGVCEISSYCSKLGGLSEGVLYVPEGFAGRVGSETLWCGC